MDISVAYEMPLGNGILTVETEAQALARARVAEMNKGGGAAESRAGRAGAQAQARCGGGGAMSAPKASRADLRRASRLAPCRRSIRWMWRHRRARGHRPVRDLLDRP